MSDEAKSAAVAATRAKSEGEPVWLRLASAAALVDATAAALRKRLARHVPPEGVVKRWGGSIMIHRERFLRWLDRA